jgi:hypothetical protein
MAKKAKKSCKKSCGKKRSSKVKDDCPDNVCPIKKKRVNESAPELSVYNPPVEPSWFDRIKKFFVG